MLVTWELGWKACAVSKEMDGAQAGERKTSFAKRAPGILLDKHFACS